MARSDWYKLDNVGKFYSAQAGRAGQTVFRFSATMSQDIDPAILQAALNRAIRLYPGFNVKLRSGMFWHYLEPADEEPLVQPEMLPVCTGLHADLDSVLFRVSYFKSRINLEMSHMISDGRGTLELFCELLKIYVEERYGDSCTLPDTTVEASRRTEDSYTANFERAKAGAGQSRKVYQLTGWKNVTEPTYMEYHLSASAVHDIAKSMDVSVTSLVIAAVIVAIRSVMSPSERDRSIQLNIPVDLRNLFGSDTMRNFFGLAFVAYTPGDQDEELADIARDVHAQIRSVTEPDSIKRRMNRMVKIEKNPLLRVAPLFLKDAALKFAEWMAARDVTTTVSSIGRIQLDEAVEPYVEDINVLTSTKGLNFLFCTVKDVLSVGISSIYVTHDVIRAFCQVFANLGVEGVISVNKDAAQIDAELIQSQIEVSIGQLGASKREGERK